MRRAFSRVAMVALCLLQACADVSAPLPAPQATGDTSAAIQVASTQGCRLDDDCVAGRFCFLARCVQECEADRGCPEGNTCSARGRCVVAVPAEAPYSVDEETLGTALTDSGAIELLGWPRDSTVAVRPAEPFVTVKVKTSAPVPGGAFLYAVQTQEGGMPRALRAEGSTEFDLTLPTGKAGVDDPTTEVVQLVTPMGQRTLYLVPQQARSGLYAGTFTPPVFGGAGLPLELVVETLPASALSLGEASAAFVWLPASPEALVSLAAPGDTSAWVRRPLQFDASVNGYVATFAEPLAADRYFGAGMFLNAERSIRLEIYEEDGATLTGAIADRWRGLFDQRSADGVRGPGIANVSGRFTLERVGRLPTAPRREGQVSLGSPRLVAPPDLAVCPADIFVFPEEQPPAPSPCGDIGTPAQFRIALAADRATCALAVAKKATPNPTLQQMLGALLDPNQPDPQGLSFKEFVQACANEADPLCKPTPALLCARELVAHAYRNVDASGSTLQELSEAYDAATREAFVGRQLAAFQVDTQRRLEWLQGGEAPAFLASTLRDYNQQLLDSWKRDVLDAHLAGVFGQLDAAGLAVLTRSPTDPVALSNRQALLLELSNSWRASMDALVLLTSRLNVLHQGTTQRAQSTATVRTLAQRLYVSAAILQELNKESGASYLGSSFGAGFSVLMRELTRLSMPFDKLLFARDAEVVASRSLDPQANSRSLLGELETQARAAVQDAAFSVDLVLDEAQQTAIDEATLTARYEDQLLAVRNELISLCGLPVGCQPSDVGSLPECDVATQAGRCGFLVEKGSSSAALPEGTTSVSEAGKVLYSLREAALGELEAEARLEGLVQQTSLLAATAEAFAGKLSAWNDQRRAVALEVSALLQEITELNDERISAALETLRAQQTVRAQAYARQERALAHWDDLRLRGLESDLKKLGTINSLTIASQVLGLAADRTDLLADIFKDAQPKQVGTATDPSFTARLGVRFPAYIASSIALVAATTLDATASSLQVTLEGQQAMREAELTNLEQLPDLDAMTLDDDLFAIQKVMEQANLQSERAISGLKALIDALERGLALDLAHDRDLQELEDRRDAWRLMLVDVVGLEYGVLQAQLTSRQRELAYYEVVQRAQLLEGRFRAMQARWSTLEGLLGSPDVLFSFANRMARAESRIDRARRALEDWLVALEYYAVRPFVEQRQAILLARNPAQLEAIANEFLRLQRSCGGPSTTETVEVSVRDDLLNMGFASLGSRSETAVTASPAERFRALLQRAQTPVSRRVPYSTVETLGQRLDRGDLWAASFSLSAESFANLSKTCNAKLASVAVKLMGEGLGQGQPVVSIVYDGASQLRSCQSGIDEYVAQLGPGSTAFAKVTAFKTGGRTISPVAGVGEFGPKVTWNATLEGLPLAAGYTVLVDLEHPSNQKLDWSRLEDVKLQLRWTYQDVFPEGQCE